MPKFKTPKQSSNTPVSPSTPPGKIVSSLLLFLSHCVSYYKLSSWWKHSTEAAKSEWSKRFVSRHVVFGSLKGIGLCHLQNIIAIHLVDELGLLCVELDFRWTIQGSKNFFDTFEYK